MSYYTYDYPHGYGMTGVSGMQQSGYTTAMQGGQGWPAAPGSMSPAGMTDMTSMPGMTGMPGTTGAPGIPSIPSGAMITPAGGNIVTAPVEESYVENILRLNRGKMATVYMTFENNSQWNAKVFRGIIEAAGRDHLILSDPSTGTRYLLLMINLDYVTFDEPIKYEYPFHGTVITNETPMETSTR